MVSPVYQRLKSVGGNGVPEAVLADLGNRYRRNVQQVLAKTAELVRLLRQFEKAGIPVLPFKGPVIGIQAYGDVGSRHVGDLDIMVGPKRALEAEVVLRGEGYQRTHPHFVLTLRQASVYVKNNHHFGYMRRDSGPRVELHWRFGSNRYFFPLGFDELWQNRQSLLLGGVNVPTLSVEHTVLLLCAHGAGHHWFRLFWLNDLARLVTGKESVEWPRLMDHADGLGIGRMVVEGVTLANLLLGSPLPVPVRTCAAKDRGLKRLVQMALHLISLPDGPSHKPFTRAYCYSKMHKALLRKDRRYKLAFCLGMLGASYGDWERVPLPDGLFPLYYLLRPAMWFLRWYAPKSRAYQEGPMGRAER